MASSEFDTLQRDCPNRVCTSQSALDRASSVNTLSGASTGLLIGGGVLAAAGVVLIIVGRPREETVQVAVGPRSVGLTVHF